MLRSIAVASVMGTALVTSAAAMSLAPAIPTPVNPHPVNPIATDGSPLPSRWSDAWIARRAASVPPVRPMEEAAGTYYGDHLTY